MEEKIIDERKDVNKEEGEENSIACFFPFFVNEQNNHKNEQKYGSN